jgi:hypothetical protein
MEARLFIVVCLLHYCDVFYVIYEVEVLVPLLKAIIIEA